MAAALATALHPDKQEPALVPRTFWLSIINT